MKQGEQQLSDWGLYPVVKANVAEPADMSELKQLLDKNGTIIARGNGRCYGDSALHHTVFSTLKLNKFLAFEPSTGVIECQSGVLFSEILEVVMPKGWFLPVTPGTKFITLGGAIAADVHGKNHHMEGCFSSHVMSMDIMLANGSTVTCTPTQNTELFWATFGGMGLTGIIVSARFQLKKIESAYIRQEQIQASNLGEIMELYEQSVNTTYSMAWIDCLAKGKNLGRSIMMRGEHAKPEDLSPSQRKNPLQPKPKLKLAVPFFFPEFVLNQFSIKAFNILYYAKQLQKHKVNIIDYDTFYYPLDAIHNWNRMYGKRGFVQYQFVLPIDKSREGLTEILGRISRSGEGSFLAVLKLFGKPRPELKFSFPDEGYTLALDFSVNKKVFKLLDELDPIIAQMGGRIYLAKDARMSREIHQQIRQNNYPAGSVYGEMNADKFESLQYQRLR